MSKTNEFKEILKKFIGNKNVPNWVWERHWRRENQVFWLIENRFGIKKDGNVVFQDANDKRKIYRLDTFFLKPRLEPCEKKEIVEIINGYLLFDKLRNGTLRAKEIVNCKNIEIRRLLLEQFGYEKFLKELKGVVVHSEGSSKLITIDAKWAGRDEEPIKLVKVKCPSSGRMYVLRVSPNMKTCREAVASTFNLSTEDYNPKIET